MGRCGSEMQEHVRKPVRHGGFALGMGLVALVAAHGAAMCEPTEYLDGWLIFSLLVPVGYVLLTVWGIWSAVARSEMFLPVGGVVLAACMIMVTSPIAGRIVTPVWGESASFAIGLLGILSIVCVALSVPVRVLRGLHRETEAEECPGDGQQ
jgi:hypothetical protein